MEEGASAFAEGRSLTPFLHRRSYRYLLGPDVFVQPVMTDEAFVNVPFPEDGRWVCWSDPEQVFDLGAQVYLGLALHQYPVFVGQNARVVRDLLP